MLVPASHHYFSRVNFIVGGSLAASMNTNIGYDQRSYFQCVQLSLASKDGQQLNTACLLTETKAGNVEVFSPLFQGTKYMGLSGQVQPCRVQPILLREQY